MKKSIIFLTLIINGTAFAGLVEPCAKWAHLPVKVCRGTEQLRYQYFSLIETLDSKKQNAKKTKKLPIHEELRHESLLQSNTLYPNPAGLWNLAKNEISNEYSKENTGIFFDFIESDDISQCDSVLFFAANSNQNVSSIGDRSDFAKNKKRIITNKDQKVPSITIVGGNDLQDYAGSSDLETQKIRFESRFRAYLAHEMGHLSGLRHTHAYKPLKYGKEKKGSTAVDVCGLDEASIMDYGVLIHSNDVADIVEKIIAKEDNGPIRFSTHGTCLNESDKKILRCLYEVGTIKDACPEVKCKYK